MSEPYRFPGMGVFVPKGSGVSPTFEAKVSGQFFLCRVADALAQIPTARPEHRAAMYDVARGGILALDLCTKTALAAFDEVMKHSPPPPDPDEVKPAPAPADASPIPVEPDPEPEPKPRKPK